MDKLGSEEHNRTQKNSLGRTTHSIKMRHVARRGWETGGNGSASCLTVRGEVRGASLKVWRSELWRCCDSGMQAGIRRRRKKCWRESSYRKRFCNTGPYTGAEERRGRERGRRGDIGTTAYPRHRGPICPSPASDHRHGQYRCQHPWRSPTS
jgi:hypothetical protein